MITYFLCSMDFVKMIFPQNNHSVLHPNLITAIKMCNFCIGINYIQTHTEREALF